MERLIKIAVVAACSLLVAGCATVKIYSDEGLSHKTGLRYYTLRPYLLVEYNATDDNTVKTSVIYLPDLAAPQYMVIRAGVGSSELKIALTNSALTSYGVVTDSKLPESLEAFANMLSKSAYAAQNFQSGSRGSQTDKQPADFALYEIIATAGGISLREVTPVK